MLIKVKFLKDGQPFGRPYTYNSNHDIEVGDTVLIDLKTKGIVTEINVPESEVEAFKDKIKTIAGKCEAPAGEENEPSVR